MKIAIAGAGPLAHYFHTTIPQHNHTTIALTRTPKATLSVLSVEQRITDYSIQSLTSHLADCDAVVSTISAPGADHITANLSLLEACKRSPNCKRFIPSDFTGNIEGFSEHVPRYMHETRESIRDALRAQREIEWTSILVGWFSEYLVPRGQRYFEDFEDGDGVGWPADFGRKVFTVYGDGLRHVTLTSVRDCVAAVAGLLGGRERWEEYTHLEGETVSWNELLGILERRNGGWRVVRKGYEEALKEVKEAERGGYGARVGAQLQLLGYTEFNRVDGEKARRQRDIFFKGLRFRGVEEVMDEAALKPDDIV